MCRFWYSWRSQLEALQEDYEVAAIDLPGYNASGKPSRISHYLTQDICRIVAAVISGLCRESCILVGTTFSQTCRHQPTRHPHTHSTGDSCLPWHINPQPQFG